jgi:hypothetical protein
MSIDKGKGIDITSVDYLPVRRKPCNDCAKMKDIYSKTAIQGIGPIRSLAPSMKAVAFKGLSAFHQALAMGYLPELGKDIAYGEGSM